MGDREERRLTSLLQPHAETTLGIVSALAPLARAGRRFSAIARLAQQQRQLERRLDRGVGSAGQPAAALRWTSADAAGLPIFAGLVRYDEAAAGNMQHALHFTVPHTRAAIVPLASHWASNTSDPKARPMGMRLRLTASYDISGFSAVNQAILTAMKKIRPDPRRQRAVRHRSFPTAVGEAITTT